MFLGVLVLRERLNATQWVAVGISIVAVVVLAFGYGQLPWIALVLAFSFGFYGLIKKRVGPKVDAVSGLTLETAWLTPLAIAQLVFVAMTTGLTMGTVSPWHTTLLLMAGAITAVPLLLFAAASRRLPLIYMGFIQYFAPFIQFLVGVVILQEPMPPERWIGFGLVWVALIVLTIDLVRSARTSRRRRAAPHRGPDLSVSRLRPPSSEGHARSERDLAAARRFRARASRQGVGKVTIPMVLHGCDRGDLFPPWGRNTVKHTASPDAALCTNPSVPRSNMSVFAKATASRSARAAWTGVALAGVSALLLTACSSGAPAPAESEEATEAAAGDALPVEAGERDLTLKIGTILPQSGTLAFLGPPEEAGVALAAKEINEADMGLTIEVVYRDSGDTTTDIATVSVTDLLSQDVSAIVGAASSGVSFTVIDQITSAGVVQFSPGEHVARLHRLRGQRPVLPYRAVRPPPG